jgi:alkaline phosphatase D
MMKKKVVALDSQHSRRALLGALAVHVPLAACVPQTPPRSGLPARSSKPGLLRIAVASCCNQNQPQPIWDAVMAEAPDHMVFAGDNVYASRQPFDIAALRAAYTQQAQVANFRRLRQQVAHSAIWDDHDYGLNDGGADFMHRQASKDAFLDFWAVPLDDERRTRPGLHHARFLEVAGGRRVQIIVLDTRWWRSALKPTDQRDAPGKERYLPDPDPSKTMLGEDQWRWLEGRLRAPADAHLIVSSIQVLAEGHGYERWGNLPLERDRFLRTIRQSGARGAVIVSGDRHIGALYREANADHQAALWEMTSSGVTHPWATANEPGPNRVGPLVRETHYGLVSFDLAAGMLTLSLRGLNNQTLQEHSVSMLGRTIG